jgi:glycosyltransferase involved in cell wall biosynthesis
MKILFLVPHLFKHGGVASYYTSLRDNLGSDYVYFFRGNRSSVITKESYLDYFLDYFRFIKVLNSHKFDLIVINTSLAKIGCTRDAVFIFLLKLFKKKFIVFFHGWSKGYEIQISSQKKYNSFPIRQFKKASAIIVLATDFKEVLKSWGFNQRIYLETTIIGDDLLKNFNINKNKYAVKDKPFTFLFLARIEKAKGIFETIKLFDSIQKYYSERKFKLLLAGDGTASEELKEYIKKNNIPNIEFLGHIVGSKKENALLNAHFFLFPSYGEGMPISVLEAMAFGLPVLTTSVGGLKDFFEDGKMGVLLENLDIEIALKKSLPILENPKQLAEISEYNHHYASEKFKSSEVSKRLKKIISEVLENNSYQA